jgi:hypothetical protein
MLLSLVDISRIIADVDVLSLVDISYIIAEIDVLSIVNISHIIVDVEMSILCLLGRAFQLVCSTACISYRYC